MIELDYDKIDPKFRQTVKAIEDKPHVRFIRYLLTKRYSPTVIKKELHRLGLSAPHEPNLTAYYLCVIDPIIKTFGVGPLYSDYKNKLLRTNTRGDYAKEILNYRLHIDDDLDMQVKFCKCIDFLEIGDLWLNEVYKYHGSAARLPIDPESGQRILNSTTTFKVVEKILSSPKRYLIDKMLLENVPDMRIAEYFKTKLDININRYDIACYKKSFFNIKTQSIEERIHSLELEKASLEQLLKDIDETEEYADLELGERMLIKKQSSDRVGELDDNIKTMNMMYSEFAFRAAGEGRNDFLGMFSDVVARGYQRFCQLDNYKDRDVVDPLVKTARMMGYAYDKVETIRATDSASKGGITDTHSQGVVMELYKRRIDDIAGEQIERANKELENLEFGALNPNISLDDIDGIEEIVTSMKSEGNE